MRFFPVLTVYLVLALADVLVVAGVFYQTNTWDLVWIWHVTLYILASVFTYLLYMIYRSKWVLVSTFTYFYFQVEDILYMILSTLLGLEPKPWLDPLYRWIWLDHTLSGYISRILGFEGATTLGVSMTALLGLLVMYISVKKAVYTTI